MFDSGIASSAIYQYAQKLRVVSINRKEIFQEVFQSLLLAKNALLLLDTPDRWLAISKNVKNPIDHEMSKLLCIIDTSKLDKEIQVAKTVFNLYDHFEFDGNPFDLDGDQVVELLISIKKFKGASEFVKILGLDPSPIFQGLARELCFIHEEHKTEGKSPGDTPTDLNQEIIQAFKMFPSTNNYETFFEELSDHSLMPEWFLQEFRMKDPNSLVRILSRSGMVEEAMRVVKESKNKTEPKQMLTLGTTNQLSLSKD